MSTPAFQSCGECGMLCDPAEYHPHTACLLYARTHDSAYVRKYVVQPAPVEPSPTCPEYCLCPVCAPDLASFRPYAGTNLEWSAKDGMVYSDDFAHDVGLKVSGDFESAEQRAAYARTIAAKLNYAGSFVELPPALVQPETAPVAWQVRERISPTEWGEWGFCKARIDTGKGAQFSAMLGGIEHQWRPLYDHAGAAPVAQADKLDAERYRWLRSQWWNDSSLFVVAGSKSHIRLGSDCPNHERLDAAIDAAMKGTA